MGNMHCEKNVAIINPPDNPYLHIVPTGESGQFRYKDSMGGMEIFVVNRLPEDKVTSPQEGIIVNLAIPLLPVLTEIPPRSIVVQDHLEELMERHFPAITGSLTPDTAGIICDHGSSWGLSPEKILAERLRSFGVSTEEYFPRTGGRKRMQQHAIVFEKASDEGTENNGNSLSETQLIKKVSPLKKIFQGISLRSK